MSFNFCASAFVYALMPAAGDGVNIDYQQHSAFQVNYPTYIYDVRPRIGDNIDTVIDGCLPAGTVLNIYLTRTQSGGDFVIFSEDREYFRETLTNASYNCSYRISNLFPYATSDRKISITLTEDTEALTLRCTNNTAIEWSGMDVYLPDAYAVERWYRYSAYDAYLNNEPEAAGVSKRKTTWVMISPRNGGTHITIHDDVSFSTEYIVTEATSKWIDAWGKAIHAFTPRFTVRFESAIESQGMTSASILGYYGDILTMLDRYGADWYSNDFALMTDLFNSPDFQCKDAELVHFGRYNNFDIKLLRLFQAHAK